MKYIVFLTTNLSNIYVGIHATENPDIFDGYLGDGIYVDQANTFKYPKTPLQFAVKRNGADKFKRLTLNVYDSIESALTKYRHIVESDFIKQDHVFNTCVNWKNKRLYQFDLDGKLLKTWNYYQEACDFYGYPQERFVKVVKDKRAFLNSYWAEKSVIRVKNYEDKGNLQVTFLYSKGGKLLKEFYSKAECEGYLKVDDVSEYIKNQLLVNDKYYVSNKLMDKFVPRPKVSYCRRIYHIYDINNKYYGEFKGKKIMPIIDTCSWRVIQNAIENNKRWYKNFYISEEKIDQVPEKRFEIKIDVYTKYGKYLESFNSLKDVREKYNVTSAQLKNIQKGEKYAGDWIFKYHSK